MNKIVFITGATSGIGKACAFLFARHGYNIIISGRREDLLDEIKNKLASVHQVNVFIIKLDVRNRNDVFQNIADLPEEWRNVDVLINNAGLALGLNTFQDGDVDDWEQMIDTNLKGLMFITKALVPRMIANRKGHIINIGSIAGKESYLNGNLYCASKAAVDSLSRSLRIDLLQHGIKVTHVAPGAVDTEFSLVRYKGDREAAKNVYKGFTPLFAEDVADMVFYAASLPPHVNINDVLIVPTAQANTSHLLRK